LHIHPNHKQPYKESQTSKLATELIPKIDSAKQQIWTIRVIAGPQGAPDFFSPDYIKQFYAADWEVHYNSSRTGVRLIGPKPIWAREDGGEAGMHPSNIHDNAYAIGTIDFTGDMPVILGPDGPSLGGFVCPATIISADLWKIGQLAAGDKVRFQAVTTDFAVTELAQQQQQINTLCSLTSVPYITGPTTPHIEQFDSNGTVVTVRQSGDSYILVEYGAHILDVELRFMVHQLMLAIKESPLTGIHELTPGIRSLQIHYDCQSMSYAKILEYLKKVSRTLSQAEHQSVPSRIVHLPLSWDDEQCQIAIEKYQQSVRKDAPWYPSNIEFIKRINGLQSIDEVKNIIFDAHYLVMGLGDVYLGAPVATPINPAHRLVTTKYNPARTWTAENCVGIGGSYLCVYGMEGPGGYQFVGRTLQMWNRYRQTKEFTKPWLLRFFDQIRFYPVSQEELHDIRQDFVLGNYPINIEETEFNLTKYKQSLIKQKNDIKQFTEKREHAFAQELHDWKANGQFHFEQPKSEPEDNEYTIPDGMIVIESPVAGSLWQTHVKTGELVQEGQCVLVLESMKMEINVNANLGGHIHALLHEDGAQIQAGMALAIIKPETQ